MHLGKFTPAMPDIRAEFNLGHALGGLTASTFNLAGVLLGAFIGSISDRFGRALTMTVGLGLLGLASLAGSFAPGAEILILARFIEGVGFSAAAASGAALVVQAASAAHMKRATTMLGVYYPMGYSTVLIAAPFFLHDGDWRGLWVAAGAFTLFYALAAYAITRNFGAADPAPASRTSFLGNLSQTASSLTPWLLLISFALYSLQQISIALWLPSYLIEERALGTFLASWSTVSVLVANASGALFAGLLMNRGMAVWSGLALSALGMGTIGPVMTLDLFPDTARLGLVLGFSFAAGFMPTVLFTGASVLVRSAAQLGTVQGMVLVGSSLGQFIGPPLLGWVVEITRTWTSISLVLGVASALLLCVALIVRSREIRP
jgi:MFS transporter, CP family, cyanate transporter